MLKYIIPSLLILCLPLAGADKEKPLPKDIPSLKALAEKGDARALYQIGGYKSLKALAEKGDAKAQ